MEGRETESQKKKADTGRSLFASAHGLADRRRIAHRVTATRSGDSPRRRFFGAAFRPEGLTTILQAANRRRSQDIHCSVSRPIDPTPVTLCVRLPHPCAHRRTSASGRKTSRRSICPYASSSMSGLGAAPRHRNGARCTDHGRLRNRRIHAIPIAHQPTAPQEIIHRLRTPAISIRRCPLRRRQIA